jgi:PhnB protein
MTANHKSSLDAIEEVLNAHAAAMSAKEADKAMSYCAPEIVRYDLAPPLISSSTREANRAKLQAWFDSWDSALRYELKDVAIAEGGGIAFAHGLLYFGGYKDGAERYLWARRTVCLRDAGAGWQIVHEHISTPFYMDGSLRAAVDLKP